MQTVARKITQEEYDKSVFAYDPSNADLYLILEDGYGDAIYVANDPTGLTNTINDGYAPERKVTIVQETGKKATITALVLWTKSAHWDGGHIDLDELEHGNVSWL